jgi:hypothetical protein
MRKKGGPGRAKEAAKEGGLLSQFAPPPDLHIDAPQHGPLISLYKKIHSGSVRCGKRSSGCELRKKGGFLRIFFRSPQQAPSAPSVAIPRGCHSSSVSDLFSDGGDLDFSRRRSKFTGIIFPTTAE